MISYRFVTISSQKGVLFFETPGTKEPGSSVIFMHFYMGGSIEWR